MDSFSQDCALLYAHMLALAIIIGMQSVRKYSHMITDKLT